MSDETGKGRPTPSRKEAEAARKKAMKQPMTRKEQAKRDRDARAKIRQKQQAALRGGGDEAYLPPRDRGPVRRFARDFVDRRLTVAEFILPILIVFLVASLVTPPTVSNVLTLYVYTTLMIVIAIDEVMLTRSLKRAAAERFPGQSLKGLTGYTVLRSFQLRRFRLPSPQVKRGEELPARY